MYKKMDDPMSTTMSGNIVAQPGQDPERPPLKSHDSSILDLAFAMDCTGSMGSYIHHAQQNIRKIVEEIICSEKCNIHMALVEYRDHPPQDNSFVTRVQDFTKSVTKMKQALDRSSANGGGDTPEAVTAALHQVLKLSWREESTKICVLIADAPPHGVNCPGDGFPNGSPDDLDPMVIVNQMAEKGITLYVVGCEPSITPYKNIFQAFAYNTGGQYVPLTSADLLSKVIIGGAQEEISLAMLMSQVEMDVQQEMTAADGDVDEDALTEQVFKKLQEQGVKTRALKASGKDLPPPSADAIELSKLPNLSEVRKKYKPEGSTGSWPMAFERRKKTTSHGFGFSSTVVADSAPMGHFAFSGPVMTDGPSKPVSLFGSSSTVETDSVEPDCFDDENVVPDSASRGLTFGGGLVTDSASSGGFAFSTPAPTSSSGVPFSAPASSSGMNFCAPVRSPASDYNVVEQSIDFSQARRLVKKSKAKLGKF